MDEFPRINDIKHEPRTITVQKDDIYWRLEDCRWHDSSAHELQLVVSVCRSTSNHLYQPILKRLICQTNNFWTNKKTSGTILLLERWTMINFELNLYFFWIRMLVLMCWNFWIYCNVFVVFVSVSICLMKPLWECKRNVAEQSDWCELQ